MGVGQPVWHDATPSFVQADASKQWHKCTHMVSEPHTQGTHQKGTVSTPKARCGGSQLWGPSDHFGTHVRSLPVSASDVVTCSMEKSNSAVMSRSVGSRCGR